jgi:hypothetical protein
MINQEEAEAFFNRMEQETKAENKRQKLFIKEAERALIKFAFNFFKEFKAYKKEWLPELKEDLHEGVVGMNEFMDIVINGNLDFEDANANDYKVPNFYDDGFYKKEIEKMKKANVYNADELAEFIDEMIALESFDKRKNDFLYGCHFTMKEQITKYFPEIIDLSSNAILNVNFTAYVNILNFNAAFIYVAFHKD